MLEFTCADDGKYDFEISFTFQNVPYKVVGVKQCNLSSFGTEFEVRKKK